MTKSRSLLAMENRVWMYGEALRKIEDPRILGSRDQARKRMKLALLQVQIGFSSNGLASG